MKTLIKLFLVVSIFFASTFVVIKLTGILSLEDIRRWLEMASTISPIYIGLLVALFLFADLFIAIPTLTVCILSGYFLGFQAGAAFSALGLGLAGISGYLLSGSIGRKLLIKIIRDPQKMEEMEQIFNRHGVVMILLSRALPILPEATACLAGFTKMPMWKFISAWMLSSLPYAAIAAYAGSISTLESPNAAIFTAVGLSTSLWIMWAVFLRKNKLATRKKRSIL